MTRTILSVAYPFAHVGPATVGGAEQILTTLEGELVARGYRSIVVARDGSGSAGQLLETAVPEGELTPEIRAAVTEAHRATVKRALLSSRIDVVHMHGIDFLEYPMPRTVPVLVTLHLPPSWYPKEIWSLPANYQLQCVSEMQRLACPAPERMPVITNGVVIPERMRWPRKREFALMLSRICAEKNLHEGMDAARLAGITVVLGGKAFRYAEHLQYLRDEIEPRLTKGVHWPGPLNGARKQRLLEAARCLLLPSRAPETSSLVAMEAIAAGTPVIAYPSGAIPEVVEDGRTGILVSNVTEMAAAIRRVNGIDPAVCRSTARERFSLDRMVNAYAAMYERLIASSRGDGVRS